MSLLKKYIICHTKTHYQTFTMLHKLARITIHKRWNYSFNNTVQKDKMSLAKITISWSALFSCIWYDDVAGNRGTWPLSLFNTSHSEVYNYIIRLQCTDMHVFILMNQSQESNSVPRSRRVTRYKTGKCTCHLFFSEESFQQWSQQIPADNQL
jgi:hypothetical protein